MTRTHHTSATAEPPITQDMLNAAQRRADLAIDAAQQAGVNPEWVQLKRREFSLELQRANVGRDQPVEPQMRSHHATYVRAAKVFQETAEGRIQARNSGKLREWELPLAGEVSAAAFKQFQATVPTAPPFHAGRFVHELEALGVSLRSVPDGIEAYPSDKITPVQRLQLETNRQAIRDVIEGLTARF